MAKKSKCVIDAPCKINLHLSVGKRRQDGFHALEGLFVTLALSDTIIFECTGKEGECLISTDWEVPGEEIIPENNLVYRAVSLFRKRTGYKEGLKIRLCKRIPAGSGLGGGSSDAASTLLALNFLAGSALSPASLAEIAVSLGSDVPFFLAGGAAFVSGRGEIIETIGAPGEAWVVLVMPPFSSATSAAYKLLDEAREHVKKGTKDKIDNKKLSKEAIIRSLGEDPHTWPFYNDFLPGFSGTSGSREMDKNAKSAVYCSLLEALRGLGASFAGLSGSGSCCFGVFSEKNHAERAAEELSGRGSFVRLTFFLAHRGNPVLE